MRKNLPELEECLSEVFSESLPHPWARGIRIWDECVMFEVASWDGCMHLSSIMSLTAKNAGNASRCLSWLCAKADKHAVDMDLTVKPIKNAGASEGRDLTKAELKSWYKRYKFKVSTGDRMFRKAVVADK